MIHDGEYYSIVNKDKILSLLDEIEQKIIWMCHRNFILDHPYPYSSMDKDGPAK